MKAISFGCSTILEVRVGEMRETSLGKCFARSFLSVEEREQAAQTILLRDRRAMKAVRDGLEQKQRK